MKNSRRKNWGTLQYHISMKDQEYYRRNNLITSWMSVYDVRTAKGIYRLDLEDYAREVVVANYLLDCNRERNAEKVRKWQTAKQAFRTSDRVTFGTKRRLVVFEQQPPCMTIGHKRLELSSVRRIVVDQQAIARLDLKQNLNFPCPFS
ncbi:MULTISPECIES: hypothetical protein [Lysinibacillus]|uniref:hypothetical protein n=1 Tax=Lysinibacillus TaxID=400634 RepID=UPI001CBE65B7|nr:hypothetical protein [Lysinibacillus sphaericus]